MTLFNQPLHELDPDVAAAVDAELHRQQSTLEMIASENFAPVAVLEAQGSVLTRRASLCCPTGTDVHLVLVDLRNSELDGRQAEDRLHEIGITVNRNAIPNDPRPPMVTSGLRIGTPALATRGFQAADFREVADIIAQALQPSFDAQALRSRVTALAAKHPLYPGL